MNWFFKPKTDIGSRAGKAVGEFANPSNREGNSLRGFIQGASEGAGGLVDDMTSPFSLMMSAAGLPWLKGAARGAKSLAGPTMDLIDSPAVRQILPKMDDVDSLIGDMQRNLARLPNRGATPVAPNVNMPSEMIQRGGEGLYNANRAAMATKEAERLSDIAYEGSKVAGRHASSPVGGNVEVLKMMAALDKARGRR